MNIQKKIILKIPKEISFITDTLEKSGFESYLVGGCVRDLIMDREPRDWDITTIAKPEQIVNLFEKTIYENNFGTVMVIQNNVSQETLRQIEITPYRTESKYSDFRHPDNVKFSENIEDDLKRRDFTINALAYRNGVLKDIFDGLKDIKKKVIRAVGDPDIRFSEDPLRMLRAIRIGLELDFSIANESSESILKNNELIKQISFERIRDEFIKIIMSKNPSLGIVMLQRFKILKHIIPELEEGINCEQGGEHIYDVWNHLLYALQHAADKGYGIEIRLSALMHDIGKPRSRRISTKGTKKYTFYGHEVVGYKMARKILERLRFPKKEVDLVEKLIKNHMFFSDTAQITLSAVRRIITKVDKENIWSLMNVRECDRVGMKKKEAPYRLRKYFAMIEEALRDPISVGQLKINGEILKNEVGIKSGPRMGFILNSLLEEVLDDPTKNTKEHLIELSKSLDLLSDQALRVLGERGKNKKEKLEEKEIEKFHKKYGVKK